MNIRDLTICGHPAKELRDLFRKYEAAPNPSFFKDGEFIRVKKLLTPEVIAAKMNASLSRSTRLLECLRKEGFVEANCDVPMQKAAALKNASAMRKIKRKTAERILRDVIKEAQRINARRRPKVSIKAIEVFGSYLTSAEHIGDVDLRVVFVRQDFSQETLSCEERIGKILRVSRYVSLHDELDLVAATATPRTRVFP